MSQYSPGAFEFAENIVDSSVRNAHRQANADRLGRQARAEGDRSHRFYSGALASLGHHLSTWGEGLQERYGAESSASVSQSAGA